MLTEVLIEYEYFKLTFALNSFFLDQYSRIYIVEKCVNELMVYFYSLSLCRYLFHVNLCMIIMCLAHNLVLIKFLYHVVVVQRPVLCHISKTQEKQVLSDSVSTDQDEQSLAVHLQLTSRSTQPIRNVKQRKEQDKTNG